MLIVDDSHTMRAYLADIAERLKLDAEQAVDGEDALSSLDRHRAVHGSRFDVALVDWNMPRMDGLQFVRAVRARREYDSMKIMMVTSHNAMDDIRAAVVAGVDDYLMKPLDAEMVAEKLRLMGLIE
jgi:two-component system chemotaxis response regulator CheY